MKICKKDFKTTPGIHVYIAYILCLAILIVCLLWRMNMFSATFRFWILICVFLSGIALALVVFHIVSYCNMACSLLEMYQKLNPNIDFSIKPFTLNRAFFQDFSERITDSARNIEQSSKYQLLQKQAQLDAMQSQINPHFLYNALDSIRGLALEQNASDTADMVEALSVLFRYSISQSNNIQTLERELNNINNYIMIQQYRFKNRFTLINKIDLDDDQLMSYPVPKLILQPIIENAIYHGFNNNPANNKITLNAYATQSRLIISIIDNGSGMDDQTLTSLNKRLIEGDSDTTIITSSDTKSSGIALLNVNSRLRLLFGEDYGVSVLSTKGIGTEISITLPLSGKIL